MTQIGPVSVLRGQKPLRQRSILVFSMLPIALNNSAVGHELCQCGSGLRTSRCCELVTALLPSPDATRHLVPLVERAVQAFRTGAVSVAERLCLDILDLAPDRPGALTILYQIRKGEGGVRAAEAIIRRIVSLDPNDLWATNEVTLLLLDKGDLAEAEMHARNAVRIAPENPQSHNLMGMVLTEAQRPAVGEYHYRKVLDLTKIRDPILLANLAWNLKTQGRMAEARALYEESLEAAPDVRQTLLGFARLEEADRKFDASAVQLDRLDELYPGDPGVGLSRAVLLGRMRQTDAALVLLDTIAAQSTGNTLGPNERLEQGRLLDQVGRYDEAFEAFVQGKQLAMDISGQGYARDQAQSLTARLRGFFTAARLQLLPRASVREASPKPIFILGFPRSGTTLVEQTLSAHPEIAAGDELPLINDITGLIPRMLSSPLNYPEALAELWMGDQHEGLDNLRDYYLQKVRQMCVVEKNNLWFTDKMPLNEMHLGLIALIFPQAPLIHVIRHPLDVMVSAISNHFTHGFFCASALETAAQHYVFVMDLVQHYRAEMALRYLPVRYEDMVDDQESVVRSILSFIGVEFDERCLHFEKNQRYARTASYAQVSEQLYDRSRYRYRNYRKQLEPLLPILGPTIERLGYSVD